MSKTYTKFNLALSQRWQCSAKRIKSDSKRDFLFVPSQIALHARLCTQQRIYYFSRIFIRWFYLFQTPNLIPTFLPSMSITLEENQPLNPNAILYDEIWAPILSLYNESCNVSLVPQTNPRFSSHTTRKTFSRRQYSGKHRMQKSYIVLQLQDINFKQIW